MNIVALASAYGVGAISVVRLSGDGALHIARQICGELTPRKAHLKRLRGRSSEILDEAIVIYFQAPFSFTGEDVVEFQTHGGVVVANLIIDEILALGARVAEPGEFSKRALINGKIDLAKAEAIQGLISARSEGAAKILARVMCGELGKFVDELRDELILALAYTETSIDYAEEDLPSDIIEQINQKLQKASQKLEKIVSISNSKKGLIDGYKVAIVGRPNVGKSSILNALLSYERAIISDTPGTTRDTIEEQIKIGTHLVRIIDTAGIRQTSHELEAIGISYSKRAAKQSDIVLCVFDGSAPLSPEDREILSFVSSLEKKVIFVLNKADLGQRLNGIEGVRTSAKQGCESLKKELMEYLNSQDTNEIMLSSNRQIVACERAREAIYRAFELLSQSQLELFAFEINSAIKEIGSITKAVENSEILDKMFSSFCLGK